MSSSLHKPDIRDVTVWIYGLIDPLTGVCRYVGKSSAPFSRLENHEANGSPAVRAWVNDMTSRGHRPVISLLHEVPPGEDVAGWESRYILHYLSHGRLLNVQMPTTETAEQSLRKARPSVAEQEFGRRTVPGSRLLAEFLEARELSYEVASTCLGVSRVAVSQWARGDKRAEGQNRAAIEQWTSGKVPADSWDDPTQVHAVVLPWSPPAANNLGLVAPPRHGRCRAPATRAAQALAIVSHRQQGDVARRLAEKVGRPVNQSSVSSWARAVVSPGGPVMLALAELFGVRAEWWLQPPVDGDPFVDPIVPKVSGGE